jgi:hypothetical protein
MTGAGESLIPISPVFHPLWEALTSQRGTRPQRRGHFDLELQLQSGHEATKLALALLVWNDALLLFLRWLIPPPHIREGSADPDLVEAPDAVT